MAESSTSNGGANNLAQEFQALYGQLEAFTSAGAEFGWTLAVFAIHQGGSVLKGLPTSSPTADATTDFKHSSECIQETFDSLDNTIFATPNQIQQLGIGLAFNLANPQNYTPKVVLESSTNVVRWGLGIAAQLIPGGKVGNGGPPTGWGPVNREDAELF